MLDSKMTIEEMDKAVEVELKTLQGYSKIVKDLNENECNHLSRSIQTRK